MALCYVTCRQHTSTNVSIGIAMKTTSTKTKETSSAPRVLEQKWGKTAMEAGFTVLPDVVFRRQKALKLKHLDILVLLHLASYWWNPKENPWPAKSTLADDLDVDPRTVQRSIKKMEDLGYIKRIERRAAHGDNLSNEYDLRGLVKAVTKLARDELDLREQRAAEDKSRRTTPQVFALVKGGKV
jgi:DNA-binding MarR family transcriptional regulator